MKTLFIDSSKKSLSVALASSSELLFVSNVDSYSRHSNFLMKEIINVLEQADTKIYDVDNIVVLNGPGGFTGVRVGVTIAKTIAWVLCKKIYSMTTLEALVLQVDNSNVISVIQDKPSGAYVGIYIDGKTNEDYLSTDEVASLINNEDVCVACFEKDDYVISLVDMLDKNNKVQLKVIENYDYMKVIDKALSKEPINPHLVEPTYLKKIDAEKNAKHD